MCRAGVGVGVEPFFMVVAQDVWSPLMMQRPLLMDPVNPFSNIVDPQDFDSRELTQFASTTHFFW